MRTLNRMPVAGAAITLALTLALTADSPRVDPDRFLGHIKVLASPDMKGRGTGTPELERAAEYIARQFREVGLQPPDGVSYFQEFDVTTNAKLDRSNHVHLKTGASSEALKFREEFIPFNFSSNGKLSGRVVFAGYGITAREYNYDDYASLDVKDKIVLILRHEPQEFDEKSVFAGKVYTEHAQFASKASNAKAHGAAAVILVNDTAVHGSEGDPLEKFGRTAGPGNAGIPFVQIKAAAAEKLLEGTGKTLAGIQADIDKDLQPRSFVLPDSVQADLEVTLKREVRRVRNVVGYLPGRKAEHVILGAHYDHLGLGEQFSMAPSQAGTPHLGADDNASGTAGLIELARLFSAQPRLERGILFVAFAGEEIGLLGSSFYANNPKLAITDAVAMLNMDMIGRVRDRKVFVGGSGTGVGLTDLVAEIAAKHPFEVDRSETAGYGSSDHTSFTTKQVPVLFFFSGLHSDYHKPSDTWDKIDAPQSARLVEMIAEVTTRLATDGTRPKYVRVEPPKSAHGSGGTAGAGGGGGGYGPDFGSIPDFADVPNGVRFADVRGGSPAAEAGLRGGDILVEFDGKPIQNLYDFTYALRAKKPGERVMVKVLRGGKPMEATVLLRARR